MGHSQRWCMSETRTRSASPRLLQSLCLPHRVNSQDSLPVNMRDQVDTVQASFGDRPQTNILYYPLQKDLRFLHQARLLRCLPESPPQVEWTPPLQGSTNQGLKNQGNSQRHRLFDPSLNKAQPAMKQKQRLQYLVFAGHQSS